LGEIIRKEKKFHVEVGTEKKGTSVKKRNWRFPLAERTYRKKTIKIE